MSHSLLRTVQVWAIILLACGLLAPSSGCALWNKSDETASEPGSDFGAKMRKPTAPGQASGFDSRAKEIEKNLGVR